MLDLMNIARTEGAGGDLLELLGGLFEPSAVRPVGYPDAVIWQGGNHDGRVNPVAHSLTDEVNYGGKARAVADQQTAIAIIDISARAGYQNAPQILLFFLFAIDGPQNNLPVKKPPRENQK